ncbi:RagB/SusD family nutrient uptake outer membrane protein [Pseudoflavitalea sp. G-6-1-2]|uniref:RagB/SusD family nutrient uptake outer membrane protein n=1 Tax=Pseudoflavitalea sp. G-6-1-2 TaxID=2728841 RepID=UPI00146B42DE|nr:RagB/SusD family nutrient uptake outer membrane protein [Pseudoflavitalea sp. G-6-1-2]NML21482.1 RagB/SusD family nutrient uptake outer membrane protein [Pseudoflavitalea sp. G-6-1-2]
MKRIIIHSITPLMLMVGFSTVSCKKDFLQTVPQQSTDVTKVVIDLPTTRAAINGMYSLLKSADYYGRSQYVNADLMADNGFLSKRNSGRYAGNDQFALNITDARVRDTWNRLYLVVANCNILIQKATALQLPASEQAEKKHILGEAYALRALAYHDLVRWYAMPYNYTADASHLGVPVVTVTNADKGEIISPKRNTVKETYKQIKDDLTKAIELMYTEPITSNPGNPGNPVGFSLSNRGRFTIGGAKALLSRVYLYTEEWASAEAVASEVISDVKKYTLIQRDKLVGGFQTQNSSEAIFEVHYSSTDNLGSDMMANFTLQAGSYGDLLATDDLFNSYDAADVRKGFLLKGSRTTAENPANLITKYTAFQTFDEGIKVIRLAEVYLNRAEARAMQGGKDAEAAADVDVIKKRAFAAPVPTVETGTALRDLIRAERRRELAFEGHRLFDLNRWKLSFTKYRSGGTVSVDYPNLRSIFPIPLNEMNANTSMEQNDAYK